MVNKDFLKQVLADKKRLMPLKKVNWVVVPKFDELSVANLQEKMKADAEFMQYFPDKLPKGRSPAREYFFNILNSIHPQYVARLIDHANRQRYTAENEERKHETIEVSDEWRELLLANPYVSRKYFIWLNSLRMQGDHHPPPEEGLQARGDAV